MRHLMGACLLFLLAGCASGPTVSEMQSAIPALDPKLGRIYFYREGTMGGAIQPSVLLNGEKVGDAVPNGFFYVDRAPGKYIAAAITEVERNVEFALKPGETVYVRLRATFGAIAARIQVEMATPSMFDYAAAQGIRYTGAAPAAVATAAVTTAAAEATPVTTAAPAARSGSRFPSPGDTWKYRQTKLGQGGGREHVVQVRSSGGGKIVDEVMIAGQAPIETDHTSGAYLIFQGVSLFSPYLNVLGPMGSSRVVPSRDTLACPVDVVCTINSSMTGFERIKLPAGEFDTRKIRLEHSWQYHRYGSGRREVMLWYADDAKRVVKVRSRTLGGGHVNIETDYDLELVEYHLK